MVSQHIHGLCPQRSSDQKHLSLPRLAIHQLLRPLTPFFHLHFDRRILLWPHTFPVLAIVVHTWLSVFGTVDRVTLAKLDLVQLAQFVHLPAHKGVVVRVYGRCDERTTPIYPAAKRIHIRLENSERSSPSE